MILQITTQFALWDRIRDVATLKSSQVQNLAHLCADLVVNLVVGVDVLKVIEFAELDAATSSFLQQTLVEVLRLAKDEQRLEKVFGAIVNSKRKLESFTDGLQLFLTHSLLPHCQRIKNETEAAMLVKKVECVIRICSASRL